MERKCCKKCLEVKSLSEFHLDRGKPRNDCKDCHNKQKRKNYLLKSEYYKSRMSEYDKSKEAKQKRSIRLKNQLGSDPTAKLKKIYRGRLQKAVSGFCRSKKSMEILGCSWQELKEHVENLFQDGMNWDNHGYNGWHLDHIIPLASAKTLADIEKLSHYSNLQPLWAKDNMLKGSRLT